jgi:hypothetical protein
LQPLAIPTLRCGRYPEDTNLGVQFLGSIDDFLVGVGGHMMGFVDYEQVKGWHLGEGVISAECLDHGKGTVSKRLFLGVTNDGLSASYVNKGG